MVQGTEGCDMDILIESLYKNNFCEEKKIIKMSLKTKKLVRKIIYKILIFY